MDLKIGSIRGKKENKESMAFQLLIAAAAILLNTGGRLIAGYFRLPFWLDTVGTCIAARYTNLWITIAVGVAANLLFGFSNPRIEIYTGVALLITLAIYQCAKRNYFEHLTPAMLSSFGLGVFSIIVAAPVDMALNGGYTGNIWGDAFHEMLEFEGFSPLLCTLGGEAILNIVDKQVSVFLAFLLIAGINRLRRSEKGRRMKQTGALALALLLLAGSAAAPVRVTALASEPERTVNLSDYVKTIYDHTNGLPSSSINMVEQTPDGYIWIGGYAGLTRFDGTRFEYITEGSISSVTAMLVDRKGRLWVGTNDRGIAIYEDEKFRFINRDSGLPDNSIRILYECSDGSIYVGVNSELCRISPDGEIILLKEKMKSVRSLSEGEDGRIAGVDYDGNFFILEHDRLAAQTKNAFGSERYTAVMADGSSYYLGTTGSSVQKVRMEDRSFRMLETIDLQELYNVNRIEKDSRGGIWFCTYGGIGYQDKQSMFRVLRYPGFDNAIEDVLEDYEGNYWFVSTRYGAMKLSQSSFADLYSYMGIENQVVNAVEKVGSYLYCATDDGLDVFDLNTRRRVTNKLTEAIGNARVRCVKQDSRGRIWCCCYEAGLVCLEGGNEIFIYNEENGTPGNYFRCLTEMKDGTIAAGGSEGITFVRDHEVVHTLTGDSGLQTTQILSLVQGEDGTLYAGSDGSGIYVIEDGKVTDILTEEDGLSSRIILRLIPYENGCFVVTSNTLSFLENGRARVIEQFPYFNNFDVILYEDQAWILCSRGIYVVEAQELLHPSSDKLRFKLFDYSNGLPGSITANSWSCVDAVGNLFFCSNTGAVRINMKQMKEYEGPYKMAITSFLADGEEICPEDGVYHLGTEVGEVRIRPSLFNYTLEDLYVRFYAEGLNRSPVAVRQSELDTVTYQNIRHGSYPVHFQILDENENIIQEQTYTIVKEARMWEYGFFRVYLLIVFAWMVVFATWIVITLFQISKRKKELEKMSQELSEKVKEQTSEIVKQSERITRMQWNMIEGMAALIEKRDGSTGAHVINTRTYVHLLAEELLREHVYPDIIDEKFVETVSKAAPLHDIGKIRISDVILNKKGAFTDEEYEIMKTHAAEGADIIRDIFGNEVDQDLLDMAEDVAGCHHERWDGRGYPAGKKGTEIPLAARIMAVADVFDALVSKRVYKEAMSVDEVYAEMVRSSGTQFEPVLIDAFVKIRPQVEAYLNEVRSREQKQGGTGKESGNQ